jgi:hypothetical protein
VDFFTIFYFIGLLHGKISGQKGVASFRGDFLHSPLFSFLFQNNGVGEQAEVSTSSRIWQYYQK